MKTYNTQWLIDTTRSLLALGTENPGERYSSDFVCIGLNWAYKRVLDYIKNSGSLKKFVAIGTENILVDEWVDLPSDVYGLVSFVDGYNQLIPNDQVMTGKGYNKDRVLFRYNRDTNVWQYMFPSELAGRLTSTINMLYGSNLTMIYAQKVDELSIDDTLHIPLLFNIMSGFEELLLQSGAVYYLWNTESCASENITKVQKFESIFNSEIQRLSDALVNFRYDEGKMSIGK